MDLTLSTIETLCSQLENSSDNVDLGALRAIIRLCHKIELRLKSENETELFDQNIIYSATKLSEILKILIKAGVNTIEGQTLCSTAYCSLFIILPDEYCEVCLRNIKTTLSCFFLQQTTQIENNLTNSLITAKTWEDNKSESRITTLISGLFQTNLLHKPQLSETSTVHHLCEEIMLISFKITTNASLTYSSNTFIHFKNLQAIVTKMIDWKCCDKVIGDIKNVLLFVVFNNWENLLTGIREINLNIWKLLLNLINENSYKNPNFFNSIVTCIFEFPWNKAKYFVLCEIIPHSKCGIREFLKDYPMCISGLEYSLKNTTLVSAGSDTYKTILNELKTFDDWIEVFLKLFEDIFGDTKNIPKSNLLNYWLPVTVKKFPELLDNLLDFFFNKTVTQNDLFPLLGIIKLGRKLGFLLNEWNCQQDVGGWNFKKYIDIGLTHINEDIRSEAFHIVCVTHKNNIPSMEEYGKVQKFLELNVNSDSTSFRQSNLNCFTIFLTRIRDACLVLLRDNRHRQSESYPQKINEIEGFFIWIHDFLIKNLDTNGNYQRKIISLHMYDIILRYLCGGYNDKHNIQKSLCRKGNLRDQGWKVVAYLESRRKWLFNTEKSIKILVSCIRDSTNDIRETAANILVQYLSDNMILKKSKTNLFVDGIVLCNSRMFYEVESGCLMFKIIAYINNGPPLKDDSFNKLIQPFAICEHLYNKAFEQFTYQECDILLSIYDNKPLHGLISAINTYIKSCHEKMAFTFMKSIRKLLTSVTNYFINKLSYKGKSRLVDVPPSFAEMDASIEDIIASSEMKIKDIKINKTQNLSNAHQLVLNNIWLNLKACCDLASTLIILRTDQLVEVDIRTYLEINISVLTRCRHKGVIESAGVSLGQSVKYLTSLRNPVYNELISDLLKKFLIQSTSESLHGVSVTRRSAGLTILVHRIVSNDSQEGKPLFYLTMELLLGVLNRSGTASHPIKSNVVKEKPQASTSFETEKEVLSTSISEVIEKEDVSTSISEVVDKEELTSSISEVVEKEVHSSSISEIVEKEVLSSSNSEVIEKEELSASISEVIEKKELSSSISEVVEKEELSSTISEAVDKEKSSTSKPVDIEVLSTSASEILKKEELLISSLKTVEKEDLSSMTSKVDEIGVPSTSKSRVVGKDELTTAIFKLLEKEEPPVLTSNAVEEDFANESDVPLARALHLLCRTVGESSLASYVIQFAPQLATVCFNLLIHDQWQVRNAALQLYGALVPKLIGQKKSQAEDTFVKSPVSPDELFSHVPSLWIYIKTSLKVASAAGNTLPSHSNIIPILSLLSSMANRYSMNEYCSEETKKLNICVAQLEDIFPYLIILIGSPIYNIRNISANVVASFYDVKYFSVHWNSRNGNPMLENELHGYLLVLKTYVMYFITFKKYLFDNRQGEEIFCLLKAILCDLDKIITEKRSSFMNKALHLAIDNMINNEKKEYCKSIKDGFELVQSYGDHTNLQIGIHHWLQIIVTHGIQNCQDNELLTILTMCIESDSFILKDLDIWSIFKDRIEDLLHSEYENFQEIFEYLINLACDEKKQVDKIVYEILYLISSKSSSIDFCGLLGRIYCNLNIEENMKTYHSGFLLPLACSMACDKDILTSNTSVHLDLSRICKQLSKPETFEAANRKMAAKSMKHLVKLLPFYRERNLVNDGINEMKCNILMSCLWLLQDEDTDVRMDCSLIHLISKNDDMGVHANVLISTILNPHYLLKVFCDSKTHAVKFLDKVSKELHVHLDKKVHNDLQNPFDHNTCNIYWEPVLLYKRVYKLIILLSKQ